jgi:hypothetical protein
MLDIVNESTAATRGRDGATSLARQVTEAARSIPYASLTPQDIKGELQAQPGLTDEGSGSSWTIHRRGFVYTLDVATCSVDDPADGAGPHDAGLFCADSGVPGIADGNPDDYKRVTVDITWTVRGGTKTVHQVAVVNNPGSAGGPSIKTLSLTSGLTSLITSNLLSVGLVAATSVPAASVAFSVDGVTTTPASGLSMLWNFSWAISPLVDGTHLVTAQAFDTQGLSGATRSITVTLNRFLPQAPTGLAGGHNGSLIDLEWLPNPERDIVGYRVFRGLPGLGATQVCPLTREVSCQDTSPPGGLLTYYAVADDLDAAGQHRDGLASLPLTVLTTNHPPNPPSSLSATSSDGATTLQWVAASPADPDGGGIAFYRIYRDGTAIADRYDRAGAAEVTYVDGRTGGTTHQYWIAAVDSQLGESSLVGPVTR